MVRKHLSYHPFLEGKKKFILICCHLITEHPRTSIKFLSPIKVELYIMLCFKVS